MDQRYRLASVQVVRYGADFAVVEDGAGGEGIEASGAAPLGSFCLVRKEAGR